MRIVLALLLSLISLPAFADITFDRASTVGMGTPMPTAGISVVITNTGPDDKIIALKSDQAASGQLNATSVDSKGMITAGQTNAIAVPGNGKTTVLNAAGDYVSLIAPKDVLKPGMTLNVTLTFEKTGDKVMKVDVVSLDEFMKRFPPEILGDNLNKSREAKEAAENGEGKSWTQRLRDKIRSLGRKSEGMPQDEGPMVPDIMKGGAPRPAPGEQSSAPRHLEGPVSTPVPSAQ